MLCLGTAVPATAATPTPLERAQRCYAEGLLGCVIEQLQGREPDPSQAGEHLRLLAFAYARLDRTSEARAVFARWIALSPNNRLAAGAVPPNVYAAYSAALLDSVRGALDLQPKAGADALPLPPEVTPGALPHIPPPPRSSRDHGSDVEIAIGLGGAYQPGGAPLVGIDGHFAALTAERTASIGVALRGGRLIGAPDPGSAAGGGILAGFGVRGAWRPLEGLRALELAVDLGGGVLQRDGDVPSVRAAIGAAIRYAPPPVRAAGWSVGLGAHSWLGDGSPSTFVGLTVAIVLRPGAAAKE